MPPDEILQVALEAQTLGFHSAWVTDHVVMPGQVVSRSPYGGGTWRYPPTSEWYDPLAVLAWVGAVARELQLGTTVLVLPLRHPVLIAKQIATLDRLSGGRVLLGIGVGWMKEEFDRAGQPWEHRGRRTEEMVRVMRQLWDGRPGAFQGKYYQLQESTSHPTPVGGSVPVLWGGHSEASLRHVARLGDGWHPTGIGLDELATGLKRLRELCEEVGRDIGSLSIVVRAGRQLSLTRGSFDRLVGLGVQHVIVTLPDAISERDAELRRVADLAGLQPRVSADL